LLADGVYRQFEIPLLEALDNYKMAVADRLATYEKGMHEQSSRIRKTEAENLKVGRRKKRGEHWQCRAKEIVLIGQTCNRFDWHWPSCNDRWMSWMVSRRDIMKRSSRGKTK
jgi:hypothetical protein